MTALWTLSRRSLITLAGGSVLVACGGEEDPNSRSAQAPVWKLTDIQPQSSAFGETYGLEAFRGTPTLVALLAGSCQTCIGIAMTLESFLQELWEEGLVVNFCAVNEAADLNPQQLTEVCTFPVFQDVEETNAWQMHGGDRDDLFIYSPEGVLTGHFDLPGGEPDGSPASATGKANLRHALFGE
jgi:hypothetical protein